VGLRVASGGGLWAFFTLGFQTTFTQVSYIPFACFSWKCSFFLSSIPLPPLEKSPFKSFPFLFFSGHLPHGAYLPLLVRSFFLFSPKTLFFSRGTMSSFGPNTKTFLAWGLHPQMIRSALFSAE